MRVVALHHVNVRVDDLEAAAVFYESVLGLAPIERPDAMPGDGRWYALGAGHSQELHVSVGGRADEASAQHFCVAVADWSAAVDELRAAGVDVDVRESTGQAFVRDPSGNRIELNQG